MNDVSLPPQLDTDVEVLEAREMWSEYRLSDGTTLRIKPVMIAVTRVADEPGVGDQSVAFTITLSTDGVAQAVLEATAVRSGRVIDGFTLRSIEVPARKSDIAVGEVALVWTPWRTGADGFPAPAYVKEGP